MSVSVYHIILDEAKYMPPRSSVFIILVDNSNEVKYTTWQGPDYLSSRITIQN